jgi:hypothetical protein
MGELVERLHAKAAGAGLPHQALVFSATSEIFLMILAASTLSLLALNRWQLVSHHVEFRLTIALLIAWVCLLALAPILFRSFFRTEIPVKIRLLAAAFFTYLCFFLLSALLFLGLVLTVSDNAEALRDWRGIIGGYAFAWAIGFITPRAPAGLGVREAVLLAVLAPRLGSFVVVIASLLMRITTTLGDLLFFLESLCWERLNRRRKSSLRPSAAAVPTPDSFDPAVDPRLENRRKLRYPIVAEARLPRLFPHQKD